MKSHSVGLCLFLLCVSMYFNAGCAAPRYEREGFNPQEIDRITVLPFVDNRKRPDPADNFQELTTVGEDFAIRTLRFYKGYRAVSSSDVGSAGGYDAAHLPVLPQERHKPVTVDQDWVRRLGPADARWVMVPVLDDLNGVYLFVFGEWDATVTFYLFDKRSANLVWANTAKYGEVGPDPIDAIVVLDKPAGPAIAGARALKIFPDRDDDAHGLITDRIKEGAPK